MAGVQPNESCRARLDAAACAAEWARALARFRAAEAALVAVERATVEACSPALARVHDQRLAAMDRALRRLLGASAPDLAAFAWKVELAIAHGVGMDRAWLPSRELIP